MPANVTDDDDGEPTEEELARLDEAATHWDRPDVKALHERWGLEAAERFWDRPDVQEILLHWDPFADLKKPSEEE